MACIKSTSHPPSPFLVLLSYQYTLRCNGHHSPKTQHRLVFSTRVSCVPELFPTHSPPNGHPFNNIVETPGKAPVIHRCLRT